MAAADVEPVRALMARWLPAGREHVLDVVPDVQPEDRETTAEKLARKALNDEVWARRWEERIPLQNRGASLRTLIRPQQDRDGRVSRFLAGTKPVLLLIGPAGHGKSNVAAAVGNEVRARGGLCEYWTAPDLRAVLLPERAESPEDAAYRRAVVPRARALDLLVIDDLGREQRDVPWGAWTQELWRIIGWRSENGKRTVITANAADDDGVAITDVVDPVSGEMIRSKGEAGARMLEERYTASTVRRILDFAVKVWVEGEPIAPSPADPFL